MDRGISWPLGFFRGHGRTVPGLCRQVSWQSLFPVTAIRPLLISANTIYHRRHLLHLLKVSFRIHSLNHFLLFEVQREYLSECFLQRIQQQPGRVARLHPRSKTAPRALCCLEVTAHTQVGHIALVSTWPFFCLNWGSLLVI